MRRLIGKCGKCEGNVYMMRNGHPGVCEDCGATEKVKVATPNVPVLEMNEQEKQLLLS